MSEQRFWLLVLVFLIAIFTLMLSGCASMTQPNQDDERTDTNLTIIACFFASCDNDISENNDSEDNKGKEK